MDWVDWPAWTAQLSEYIATSKPLNSNFVTSLIGSLAGAGAGAWAGAYIAQKIAARAKLKDEMLREIRGTNEAISAAFAICQSALRLKASGVLELRTRFDQELAELLAVHADRAHGVIRHDIEYRFFADMETITPFPIPSDVLQTLVFEKISVLGRPHQLTLQITPTWHSLNEAIVNRNSLINEFRERWPNGGVPPHIYFGLPDGDGNIDARYSTALDGIYQQTDDCIAFSKILCEDLKRHGDTVWKSFVKRFGRRVAPRISDFNFDVAAARGLLPPERNYSDWTTMFVVRPPEQTFFGRVAETVRAVGRQIYIVLKWIGRTSNQMWRWTVRETRHVYFALSFLMLWTGDFFRGRRR